MSYGIIRIAKYKKGSVKGLQVHDQREKDVSHSNKDIDFDKSYMNYDLHNPKDINYTGKVNERIKELNLKKAVRKDAVVMCQCLITSDNDFFKNLSDEKQKSFFEDSYNFICERYGEKNIISAVVHHDERTPHLHINFVPVTDDGRLCAKDLFKKQDLIRLHDDFYKFNQSKGYDLERGEDKEKFQRHLTTEEFKIKVQKQAIEREDSELIKARMKLGETKSKLEDDEIYVKGLQQEVNRKLQYATQVLNDYNNLRIFGPEKMVFQSGKLKINKSDYEKLSALANIGILKINAEKENEKLKIENEKLKTKCSELEEKNKSSITKKINEIQKHNFEVGKLNSRIDSLEDFFERVNKYLNKNKLVKDFNNFSDELKKQEKIEYEKNQDWDLER